MHQLRTALLAAGWAVHLSCAGTVHPTRASLPVVLGVYCLLAHVTLWVCFGLGLASALSQDASLSSPETLAGSYST